ncbi:MAG: LPXTG cell wall anchor domain-containing protein [Candidatus Peribacteraceae bacterium]
MTVLRGFLTSCIIVTLSAVAGLAIVQNAYAAGGSLAIEQVSQTRLYGTWVLSTPDSRTIVDNRGVPSKTVTPVVGGTYTISVDAPEKARTTIVVYRGTNVLHNTEGTRLSFTLLEDDTARVVITHRFFGTITVESDPVGQAFVLTGSDGTNQTGTTPASFYSMSPQSYTVQYSMLDKCIAPHNQSRPLEPNGSLAFLGVYRCSFPVIDITPPEPEQETVAPQSIEFSLLANQNEVLPGGMLHYTLTVANHNHSTLHNLQVSVQFDPQQVAVSGVRDNGRIQRNLMIWEVPGIYAGQQWSTTFTADVQDGLPAGEQITMTTRASADGLVEAGMLPQMLAQSVGVALLPQTGEDKTFALLSILMMLGALTTATTIRRRRSVVLQKAF